jgi:hypothetical protein
MWTSDPYAETDALNNVIDFVALDDEVRASALPGYVELTRSGDQYRFIFQAELSAGDKTTLTGLVNAHTGDPPATPKNERDPTAGDAGYLGEVRVNEGPSKQAFICVDPSPGEEVWKPATA